MSVHRRLRRAARSPRLRLRSDASKDCRDESPLPRFMNLTYPHHLISQSVISGRPRSGGVKLVPGSGKGRSAAEHRTPAPADPSMWGRARRLGLVAPRGNSSRRQRPARSSRLTKSRDSLLPKYCLYPSQKSCAPLLLQLPPQRKWPIPAFKFLCSCGCPHLHLPRNGELRHSPRPSRPAHFPHRTISP